MQMYTENTVDWRYILYTHAKKTPYTEEDDSVNENMGKSGYEKKSPFLIA